MKIFCIGRNYEAHAKELENPLPEEVIVFMKPDSALLRNNAPFYIPDFSQEIHYETEIIVRINRLGKGIDEKFANRYFNEIGLGIDFTARDLQNELRKKGLPWEKCKGFDNSAVISDFVNIENFQNDIFSLPFHLEINGEIRQKGNTKDMIFNINKIISELSKFFTLKTGDIIFTGTPAGVSRVETGDRLKGFIEEKCFFDFLIK